MRKLICLFLAIVLICSLSLTAFAATWVRAACPTCGKPAVKMTQYYEPDTGRILAQLTCPDGHIWYSYMDE